MTIIGRVEHVILREAGMKLKARIDTGAGLSSIHAKIIELCPAEGTTAERVIFEVHDRHERVRRLEREVVRWAGIKGKETPNRMRRPVVLLSFTLGDKVLSGYVNLADRGHFLYPVLIGRSILKQGRFLIDPRKKFVTRPHDG